MMRWTRWSFSYLITYLVLGGVGLLAAPQAALRLLGSTGDYPSVLARFLGAFLLTLGIIVTQITRHRAQVLYPTVLGVRVVLLGTILGLYFESRDPLFLTLAGIVGLGMLLTAAGLILDRRSGGRPSAGARP